MQRFHRLLPAPLFDLTDILVDICGEIYLVGGAIRNFLINRDIKDFDFVAKKHTIQAARKVVDNFNGDFYILDKGRKTARALVNLDGKQLKLDFAEFNGVNIEQDLARRDFTINAMAIRLPAMEQIIDPLDGEEHLKQSRLFLCSPTALNDDPVRTIRIVRFAQEFNLRIDPNIVPIIDSASRNLINVSAERKRDAFLDVIRTADAKAAFDQMKAYGIFHEILPDVVMLSNITLTPPHTYNAWTHTLQVVTYCQQILAGIGIAPNIIEFHPRLEQALSRLEKFKPFIKTYFKKKVAVERTKYQLLILSALYHDAGKAVVRDEFDGSRKRFPNHARVGAELARDWAKKMGFSNKEVTCLVNTIKYHMKPSKPSFTDHLRKDIAIHRFFKKAGKAGILIAILHLADVLTTYEDALTDERWDQAVSAVENIFKACFIRYEMIIAPAPLLNGDEILDLMHLKPGKKIGKLIIALTEAQVVGEIHNRGEAVNFLQKMIASDVD